MISYDHDHVTCSSTRIQRAAAMRGLLCAFAVLLAVLCQVGFQKVVRDASLMGKTWVHRKGPEQHVISIGFCNMDGQNHYSRRLQIYTVLYKSTYNYFWNLLNSFCLLREDHHAAGYRYIQNEGLEMCQFVQCFSRSSRIKLTKGNVEKHMMLCIYGAFHGGTP